MTCMGQHSTASTQLRRSLVEPYEDGQHWVTDNDVNTYVCDTLAAEAHRVLLVEAHEEDEHSVVG